jgi:hypothetical protein
LIAQIAQPLQPIIDTEKPWLPPHAFAPNPSNPMELEPSTLHLRTHLLRPQIV